MIKNKKIFITGGAGFIAKRIIERVISDNQVIIFDNFKRNSFAGSDLLSHKNLKIIRGDVQNYEILRNAIKNSEIVIHAAAIAGVDSVIKMPVTTMLVNMIGTANVLKASQEIGSVERFINFSTSEIFGAMAWKSDELQAAVSGALGEARWTYSVSKLAGEHLAYAYFKEFNLPVVNLRPFNIYGPGQTGEGALVKFVKQAIFNEDIVIDGDGSQIRAWCFVDDFVNALLACLENQRSIGQSYNIGNPRAVITILGLAQTVCRVLGSKSKIKHGPALAADISVRVPSTHKMRKELGIKTMTDLEQGVITTAKWIKEFNG